MKWIVRIVEFLRKNRFEREIILCRHTYALFHGYQFGSIGKKTYLYKPIFLSGTGNIFLGEDVEIWGNARIEAVKRYNSDVFAPKICFGDRIKIGQDSHITCAEKIEIGDDTVCAARVTITDIRHRTDRDCGNVVKDGTIETAPVRIGEGCFIGNNAVILPGVRIGKYAVIGANSVVGKDIPEYAIVYGNPARVVRYRE